MRKRVPESGSRYAKRVRAKPEVGTWNLNKFGCGRKSTKLWKEHADINAEHDKVGRPVSKALNISMAIVNLMRI